nr:PDR/VanB family oxidoreductase [Burkholderia sp. USMB20]
MMDHTMFPVRVARKTREADGIFSFEFVHVDGDWLPEFSAGAHIDVRVGHGLTRQYSLCNCPSERHRYVIAVLKEPNSRGGSVAMHDQIAEGDVIQISQPRNHFPLCSESKDSLLLAGGIGVTPILSMAEQLASTGAQFEMHYCARSLERTAFVDRIRGSAFGDHVCFHFDDGPPDQRLDLAVLLGKPTEDRHLYVCGPRGFLDAVIETAKEAGWTESNIHFEYFSAPVQVAENDGAFEVRVASSGKIVRVTADQTVISALAGAGVDVPVSCELGVCGTCLTRVLEGVPDHRDSYLTNFERDSNHQFLPCCSRAKTPLLVLDL